MTVAVGARALSARQARTREQLLRAAVALVEEEHAAATTMRDIARRAGVSTATAYTYFGSREHVLAEAYARWVDGLTAGLDESPVEGADAAARVRAVFARAAAGVADHPRLARAFTLALAADDPSVALVRPRIEVAFRRWLARALGDDPHQEQDSEVRTLELVLYAAMITFAHGAIDELELAETLDDAVRVILA